MAAVFPLDTTKPWIFNGVTYEYDASEDRWYVVSTIATDQVVDNIDTLNQEIIRGFDERDSLIELGTSKNNQQDAAIAELDARVDALSAASGSLQFKGRYKYVLEKTDASCDAALAEALLQGVDQVTALRAHSDCITAVGAPLEVGTFTSVGTLDQQATEELIITTQDLDGLVFDWENLLEDQDYIELVESTQGDTVLYQVISDPIRNNEEERIRVKFIKETGSGDGNFNLQEVSEIRVFKASQGLDLTEADLRYTQKPYVVYFEDNASDITPVHSSGELKNGELWYDTDSLELFTWNNTAWTATARPPSADGTFQALSADVDQLRQEAYVDAQRLNSVISDALLENNIYYSDSAPTGDITGTLRNGDLWVDSDDLQIKFYSGGAWVNPDRQVGGDYLEKSGGTMSGDLVIETTAELGFQVETNQLGASFQRWNEKQIRFRVEKDKEINFTGYWQGGSEKRWMYWNGDTTEGQGPGLRIHYLVDPIDDGDSVNLGYLNTNYLQLTGGTVTGDIHIKDSSNDLAVDIRPNESSNKLDVHGDQRITGKFKVKKLSNSIDGGNSFEVGQSSADINDIPLVVKNGGFENLKVDTDGKVWGREGYVPSVNRQLVNKKYVDDKVLTSNDSFVYVAQNIMADTDWQDSTSDGKFSAHGQLGNNNSFWNFSDIDQNGKMLNLREFSSSENEKLYIQIGHYSYTYLNDPSVNRDGMKIVWAGMVNQASRIRTGPVNNKVNVPGWELVLQRGTSGDDPIPGGTITSGGTYYIKIGGLL